MPDEQLARTDMLAASEAEHARLVALARRFVDQVGEMCARADVGAGARVVDVGCGSLGALLELAEIAGPSGSVVGVDSSADDVARRLPGLCAEAGLRVLDVRGGFPLPTPAREHLGVARATLLSARRSIVGAG